MDERASSLGIAQGIAQGGGGKGKKATNQPVGPAPVHNSQSVPCIARGRAVTLPQTGLRAHCWSLSVSETMPSKVKAPGSRAARRPPPPCRPSENCSRRVRRFRRAMSRFGCRLRP